eukprot:9095061-Alexandrium_andersonii.AAC.1
MLRRIARSVGRGPLHRGPCLAEGVAARAGPARELPRDARDGPGPDPHVAARGTPRALLLA